MSKSPQPIVGISACLLGEKVRFDGQHKRNPWLVEQLSNHVQWEMVCPELQMGLGTPRESMQIKQRKLIGNRTGNDYTELAKQTSEHILDSLDELDGFVLKKKSPSCGIEVKGFFATALAKARPHLALIEEGRLSDPEQREHFVIRVFASARWRAVTAKVADIQRFHQRHKLLLMSHSPRHYQLLGKIAAHPTREAYAPLFFEALAIPTTNKKRTNVLQHVQGYFKEQISAREKQALTTMMEKFRQGELSFLAAIESLRNLLFRFPNPYLEDQLFFDPYPKALNLRRHL